MRLKSDWEFTSDNEVKLSSELPEHWIRDPMVDMITRNQLKLSLKLSEQDLESIGERLVDIPQIGLRMIEKAQRKEDVATIRLILLENKYDLIVCKLRKMYVTIKGKRLFLTRTYEVTYNDS